MTKKEVALTTVRDLLGDQTSVKDRLGDQWVLKRFKMPWPEEHHHEEQQAFRYAVRTYIAGSFAKQTTTRRASPWRFLEPAQVRLTTEHLEQLFAALESAVQSGLAQSVTASTLSFVSNRVRDLDRRMQAMEARFDEAEQKRFVVWVDLNKILAHANEVAKELNWSGEWVVYAEERRLEFRFNAAHADKIAETTFDFYRLMARRLEGQGIEHVTFDYEVTA